MPIFMDLHIIPGIKAKDVAEAHRLDLQIQSKYKCNCMTYWIDEANEQVFCLIDAPSAGAVKKLHNEAHGFLPHKIIQVNETIVESFLGRIYDPETPEIPDGQLKVFNDSAFRVLVLIKIKDVILLTRKSEEDANLLLKYQQCLSHYAAEFNGEITEHNEDIASILSFTSASSALACAIAIHDFFSISERDLLEIKISINGGLPVIKSSRLFGDVIDLGLRLHSLNTSHRVITASVIGNINQKYLDKQQSRGIMSIGSSDEKLLNQLFSVLEENYHDDNFNVATFYKQMALSKSSLNRVTHSLVGKTPNALINEYRLEKAFQLLKKKNHTVSEVAFTIGFNSPSYFSKSFKTFYGISPSDFG